MDANKDQTSILGNAKPSQAIVKLALPATLALLAKAVYNIVDAAYIGMLGSDIALTAVGVTVPLLLIMVSIENIFAARAAVLAGRQLGFFSSVLFGVIFSIGWTPCVGAFLGSALMLASQQASVAQGVILLLCYSAGLGIPFVAAAALIDKLKGA